MLCSPPSRTKPNPPRAHELQQLRQWLLRERARKGLTYFCQWIDPSQAERYAARHLVKIAEELERVERGECKRLFITAPPRHWKSSLVSEKYPLWLLSRNPQASVGIFSHGERLPVKFSRNIRGNIEGNPRYRELFPAIKLGKSTESDWSLAGTYRSSLRAFGVGGSPTGEGFDCIILDDLIADAAEAYSPTTLNKVWTWYQETLRDRLNPGGSIIMVMSRWHENDPAGRVLRASEDGTGERWECLHLPALAESGDVLGREDGDPLWPDRWPLEELRKIRQAQGERAFAARFQGRPRAMKGNLLESGLLQMRDADAAPTRWRKLVRRWDLAFSDATGADWSAGVKMGLAHDGARWILHVKRVKGRWPQVAPVIMDTAKQDGQTCHVLVECNGTQLGYADEMKVHPRMSGYVVKGDKPQGSKEMRATLWGSRLEDGILCCVRGAWNGDLVNEMDSFPAGEHDDVIDGVSGAWAYCGAASGAIDPNRLPVLSKVIDELALE